jgi:CRISPR-associated endonuclease/helicase Cas3
MAAAELHADFKALTGLPPLSWQKRLLAQFVSGEPLPEAVALPTGMGKTKVMAIWLAARARGARLPRRLVYVVDRRAVVDQATEDALRLSEALEGPAAHLCKELGLGGRKLPVSTLRGQQADNREWMRDPSAPAIIVGTVDKIGSALLFEGYGVSRTMRSRLAGLLGHDVLLVLDEAHLCAPFHRMVESVERNQSLRGRNLGFRDLAPGFQLLPLSATLGPNGGSASDASLQRGPVFKLDQTDDGDEIVRKRFHAPKRLRLVKSQGDLVAELVEEAWRLSLVLGNVRVAVFCDKRGTAQKVKEALAKRAQPRASAAPLADTELFVGARRVRERMRASHRLKELGFIAGSETMPARRAFLVCTSAAEVGVDLDAHCMVCDVAPFERMVQRLGRVNRRGESVAEITVVWDPEAEDKTPKSRDAAGAVVVDDAPHDDDADVEAASEAAGSTTAEVRTPILRAARMAIMRLSDPDPATGAFDASPRSIEDLKARSREDADLRQLLENATTPDPLFPPLERPLLDAWSLTGLHEHPGRPEVAPWLRGWVDDDEPQASLVWRMHLPLPVAEGEDEVGFARPEIGRSAALRLASAYFDIARIDVSERLDAEVSEIAAWLKKRLRGGLTAGETKLPGDVVVGILLDGDNQACDLFSIDALAAPGKDLAARLAGKTLVLDARVGGVDPEDGLLDHTIGDPALSIDGDPERWRADDAAPQPRFKVEKGVEGEPEGGRVLKGAHRFVLRPADTRQAQLCLFVELVAGADDDEDTRSTAKRNQSLAEHSAWARAAAERQSRLLGLPSDWAEDIAFALEHHDTGKARMLWQRAMGKSKKDADWPYAKTDGKGADFKLLAGYRHEFGSIVDLLHSEEVSALDPIRQDLRLHLIASHHGHARPNLNAFDPETDPGVTEPLAGAIALRFLRLQRELGPWGLAWLEAIVHAADVEASMRRGAESGLERSHE